MTEAEWLESTDWLAMWEFVRHNPSERKLRLFSCACCRRIWDLLTDERSREVVVIAEFFADDKATSKELHDADNAALDACNDPDFLAARRRGRLRPHSRLNNLR
jgi:hypothetical protein